MDQRIAALEDEVMDLSAGEKRAEIVPIVPKGRKWVKLSEAALILGQSQATVRRYIDKGLLRKNELSRHIMIPTEDVEKFADQVIL